MAALRLVVAVLALAAARVAAKVRTIPRALPVFSLFLLFLSLASFLSPFPVLLSPACYTYVEWPCYNRAAIRSVKEAGVIIFLFFRAPFLATFFGRSKTDAPLCSFLLCFRRPPPLLLRTTTPASDEISWTEPRREHSAVACWMGTAMER